MRMRILVIFTGGTIGSTVSGGWISPDDSARYTLLNTFRQQHGDDVTFVTRSPFSILSENLSAATLSALVNEVTSALNEDFDGIIVTHGTDTLQFSAAALAYATGNDTFPIVLVSSNYPLDDKRANGNANFSAAVNFIKNACGRGVFISYKNENNAVTFHNALETLRHMESDDSVFSMHGKVYAHETADGIHVTGKSMPCDKLSANFSAVAPVLVIDLHPADGYSYALENYRAVILRPYHSGTLNTDSPSFIAFCERAKKMNIPVYVVNAPDGAAYASSKAFEALGIIPLFNETFASAYIRLWMRLSEQNR